MCDLCGNVFVSYGTVAVYGQLGSVSPVALSISRWDRVSRGGGVGRDAKTLEAPHGVTRSLRLSAISQIHSLAGIF